MDWQALLDEDWVFYFLLPGIAAAVLGIVSWYADRRRMNRSNPDAVGWLPWRDMAFWASFAAVILFGAALRGYLSSGLA